MRTTAILVPLLFALCGGVVFADEPAPETRAFVEVHGPDTTVFVGQPFTLRLRVGYDGAYFEKHAAPLFRRVAALYFGLEDEAPDVQGQGD